MSSQRVPLLKPKSVRKPTRVAIGPRPTSSQPSKVATPSVAPRPRTNSTSADQTQEKTQLDAETKTTEKEKQDASMEELDPIAILSTPMVVKTTKKNTIAPGGSFGTPRLASMSKNNVPAIHIPPVTPIEKSPKITPTLQQRKTPPPKLFIPSKPTTKSPASKSPISKSPISKSPIISTKEPTKTPPAKPLTSTAEERVESTAPSTEKTTSKKKSTKASAPKAKETDKTAVKSKTRTAKKSTKAKSPRSSTSDEPTAKRSKRLTRSKGTPEEETSPTEKDTPKPTKTLPTRLSTLRKKTKERAIVSAKDRVLKYARKVLASDYDKQKPVAKPREKRVEEAISESEDEIASAALVAKQTMGELALSIPVGRRVESEVEEEEEEEDAPVKRKPRKATSGAPQVEFIDGQIVISQSSLTVHDDELTVTQDSDGENERSNRRYGSGYLAGRRQTKRWTHPETKQFFYHLSQIGPDFTLMSTLFPHRTRYELKQKFKKEERSHRSLVELALSAANRPIASDIMELAGDILENEKQKKLQEKLDKEEENEDKEDDISDELVNLY
ncbi:hypothetical protein THRCLA_06270 [Thraustotheca clavata]|uniref:Myb-like domain-containing protein n=1 Tax=Thraustotheca clavata TaxID=74557 RepID=A0A1V9ZPZ8_9STRA|nr:hypothetical protein THRCLA_06270 [Thraustotheca clavata]